jgi:hypothetical protein
MIDRVQRATPKTISKPFMEDGVAANPGVVTVTITRADGTVVAEDAATGGSGASARTYNLSITDTAVLDNLTATWTSATKGTLATTVEIVGGFVFSISDVRATAWGAATNNDGTFRVSTADIVEARTEVERALEHELSFAMVPRYSLETVDGPGGTDILLRPYVRVVRSVSVAGSVFGAGDLALVAANPWGRAYYAGGWASGFSNVVVGYEHGLDSPPAGAKQVALALAKRILVGAPADDRATSVSTEEQTTTFYVPGSSEPFDVPAANRFVASHTLRTGLA